MATGSGRPEYSWEFSAVCKWQCFTSSQGTRTITLNVMITLIFKFNTEWGFDDIYIYVLQSLRGALLAVSYSSVVLSAFTTVGLILLARRLKSNEE